MHSDNVSSGLPDSADHWAVGRRLAQHAVSLSADSKKNRQTTAVDVPRRTLQATTV